MVLRALLCAIGLIPQIGVTDGAPSPVPGAEAPHVLLIVTDDQRADTISAWGNPHIRTPHLDALGARGTSFRRAYCLGSRGGAVCIPSRAMIHAGRPYFGLDLQMKEGTRRSEGGSVRRAIRRSTPASGTTGGRACGAASSRGARSCSAA